MPSIRLLAPALLLATVCAAPILPKSAQAEPANDGSVTIEKLRIPLPDDLSPEIRHRLINHPWPQLPPAQQEAFMQHEAAENNKRAIEHFGVSVNHEIWSGVTVNVVKPAKVAASASEAILLHIHGGGFSRCGGECSYGEAIQMAGRSGIEVVSVDYTLVPKAQFPQAVEEIVSVYQKLLRAHNPSKIAIFGSSAGAVLTAEVTARLIKDGLPVPAALGMFSGGGDLGNNGDSANLYTLSGFSREGNTGTAMLDQLARAYAGKTNFRDPLLSPIYSDLSKFPPTLLMSSTRDILLSATSNFERALHRAGVKTQFAVFDGLYHVFWAPPDTPEGEEALARQACFLAQHVGADIAANHICTRQ